MTYQRPRGYITDWNPYAKTRRRLAQVDEILAEYEAHLPLTLRQIFYRMVGAYDYPKTKQAYENLSYTLGMARRAGRIPFEAVRDDGITAYTPRVYVSPWEFWCDVADNAESYRRERQENQDARVEVWCEAAGMASQIASVVAEYGVPVFSSGGFDSLTSKWEAAQRIEDQGHTVVLHVGDYDEAGEDIYTAVAEDVEAFVRPGGVEFRRVAITPEQIERYDLPAAPDSGAVQAEALPPDALADEIRHAVLSEIDADVLAEIVAEEAVEREQIRDMVEKVRARS
jgi:hypothetical protein